VPDTVSLLFRNNIRLMFWNTELLLSFAVPILPQDRRIGKRDRKSSFMMECLLKV
jgi:hypothetical protein